MAPSAPAAPLPPGLGGEAPGGFTPQFGSWTYQRQQASRAGQGIPAPIATPTPVEDPMERRGAPVTESLKDISVLTPKMQLDDLRRARREDVDAPLSSAVQEMIKEQGLDPTPIRKQEVVPIVANVIGNFVSQTSKTAPAVVAAAEREYRNIVPPQSEPNTARPEQFRNPTKELQQLRALPGPLRVMAEAGMIMMGDVGRDLTLRETSLKLASALALAWFCLNLLLLSRWVRQRQGLR